MTITRRATTTSARPFAYQPGDEGLLTDAIGAFTTSRDASWALLLMDELDECLDHLDGMVSEHEARAMRDAANARGV